MSLNPNASRRSACGFDSAKDIAWREGLREQYIQDQLLHSPTHPFSLNAKENGAYAGRSRFQELSLEVGRANDSTACS